jgi:crossover junction endodeoxyribonuclease RuvC
MIYIGIDPGASGGIACIWESGQAEAWKMPETERDAAALLWQFNRLEDSELSIELFAVIEQVGAMPGNGVTGMFKFGMNYGFLRGLLTAFEIPFDEVRPQTWQKAMGCMSKGNKNITKAKAQQLHPELKITHATADAILLAEYAKTAYSVSRVL